MLAGAMTTKRGEDTGDAVKKVRALAKLVEALERGESFEITKLTVLKALCAERKPRVLFAHHIATLAQAAMKPHARHVGLTAEQWSNFRSTVAVAVDLLERYTKRPNDEPAPDLLSASVQLKSLQNSTKTIHGGPVRMIDDENTLAVENAVHAATSRDQGGHFAYRAARAYAGRWDPHTGRELCKASAPMVRQIADFWCRYLLDQPLGDFLEQIANPVPKRAAKALALPPAGAIKLGRPTATSMSKVKRAKSTKVSPPVSDAFSAKYPKLASWIKYDGGIELGMDGMSPGPCAKLLCEGNVYWESEEPFDSFDEVFESMERAIEALDQDDTE